MPRKIRKPKKKKNLSKKWEWIKLIASIIAASLFFVVISVAAVIHFYRGGGGNMEIEINVLSEEVIRGEVFDLEIIAINNTTSQINSASFSLSLSDGLVGVLPSGNTRSINEEVGDISSGGLVRRTFKVLPIGDINSEEVVNTNFSYNFGRTSFRDSQSKEVNIEGEIMGLEIRSADELVAGSPYNFSINYENMGDIDISNVVLELSYPDSFNFRTSNFPPDSLNNHWRLGSLMAGSEGEITVSGFLDSMSGNQDISAIIKMEINGEQFVVAETVKGLNVSSSVVGLNLSLSGDIHPGNAVQYFIDYQNEGNSILRDVIIRANISGEVFDINNVSSDGLYDPMSGQITWDGNNYPNLTSLDPGEAGRLSFSVRIIDPLPIRRLSDRNFSVNVDASLESPSFDVENVDPLTYQTSLETKVPGYISVEPRVYYRDPDAGVINQGSLPPRLGEPNQYTVHLYLRNYSTNVKNVELSTVLPQGVEWVNFISSNLDQEPYYDSSTRSIIWNISEISATRGILDEPIRAIIQIQATPSFDMVGQFQQLLSVITVEAIDDWTGELIRSTASGVDTRLIYDPTVDEDDGIVVE